LFLCHVKNTLTWNVHLHWVFKVFGRIAKGVQSALRGPRKFVAQAVVACIGGGDTTAIRDILFFSIINYYLVKLLILYLILLGFYIFNIVQQFHSYYVVNSWVESTLVQEYQTFLFHLSVQCLHLRRNITRCHQVFIIFQTNFRYQRMERCRYKTNYYICVFNQSLQIILLINEIIIYLNIN